MEDGNYTRSLENLEKSIAWKILNSQKKKKKKVNFITEKWTKMNNWFLQDTSFTRILGKRGSNFQLADKGYKQEIFLLSSA